MCASVALWLVTDCWELQESDGEDDSTRPPRDQFVEDPAKLREQAARRAASRGAR